MKKLSFMQAVTIWVAKAWAFVTGKTISAEDHIILAEKEVSRAKSDLKERLTQAFANEARLEGQLSKLNTDISTSKRQAEQAVKDNNDATARQCLHKVAILGNSVTAIATAITTTKGTVEKLTKLHDSLRLKEAQLEVARTTIQSRQLVADTVGSVPTGEWNFNYQNWLSEAERLVEEEVIVNESKAKAADVLNPVSEETVVLNVDIEEELAKLKASVGK
jgi:phage shock protein A